MHLAIFQHVPFEGPGLIADWAGERGHSLTLYTLYDPATVLPTVDAFDMLVVMGGPMGVDDVTAHPWLVGEKRCIREAIAAGKYVLGVCLGAQLIAEALGAEVMPNPLAEIGWFPVAVCDEALGHPLLSGMNTAMTVLHWHGETFALPASASWLMQSAACAHQAFVRERVLGLQFHLEMTADGIEAIMSACPDYLVEGSEAVQSVRQIRDGVRHIPACRRVLFGMLDNWVAA